MSAAFKLLATNAFGGLSLKEKNDYLQEVSKRLAEVHGQPAPEPLDKDSLARLRRFYMRRRLSDLALDTVRDGAMRRALQAMGDAVHLGEVRKAIAHETRSYDTYREAPADDNQLMFFVPTLHDAPVKDEMNLMDIAPFSLSKTVRRGIIRYQLKDCLITIEGGAETGIVTTFDYDIFIHMVTSLAAEMRDFRIAERKGLRPSLPPRIYRPRTAEILKFCRRDQGGRQYLELERSLDRLQATRYKITNLTDNSTRRASESFPLIGRYKVVSRTDRKRIEQVEIEIPEWVYQGVVTVSENPSILTLNPDYFLIRRPIARYIYRLARKACGSTGIAEYGLATLHARSGSLMPLHKFREALEDALKAAEKRPLPDYNFVIVPGKGDDKLRMTIRKALPDTSADAA